jgi:hypothetical protein
LCVCVCVHAVCMRVRVAQAHRHTLAHLTFVALLDIGLGLLY